MESDEENGETIKLKLFFLDLKSVPRNHIRYISWIAYLVRRDSKSGQMRDSLAVCNSPHSNYYLQDGIDMGTIMDTDIPVKEVSCSLVPPLPLPCRLIGFPTAADNWRAGATGSVCQMSSRALVSWS